MSFFSDLFEGNFSNLGTDISHAPESLAKHPSELYETLGGAAAVATGGLGLGLMGAEAGAAGLGGLLGEGGAAAGAGAGDALGAIDTAIGAGGDAGIPSTLTSFADAGGSTLGSGFPSTGGLGGITNSLGAGGMGGDVTGAIGAETPGITPIASGTEPGANFGAGSAAAPEAGGGGSFLGQLGQGAINSVTKNPLGIAAAGGLLGYDLLKGNPTDPNQAALKQKADQLGAQGDTLRNYLATGTLPPALKAQLDQATKAEKARITSGYAARGQPTDPNQNSALAQELNAVDTNAVAAMAQAQIQMLNTGINETGMSTQLYETLVKLDSAQNDQLMKAISSFAAALGGGGARTIQIQ